MGGGSFGGGRKIILPLHLAALNGQKKIAELLIAKGADVNAKDIGGETPLDWAARESPLNSPEVKAANKETAALLRKHGGKTTRPNISIHQAAGAQGRKGNIEAVKWHLAAAMDVDARDRQDKTPLQHAAYWGHKEIVELLIAKNADINAKDEDGRTALDWAVSGGKKEIVKLLIAKKTEIGKTKKELEAAESIHDASRYGNIEAVKQHLAAGVDVNAKSDDGGTPLLYAAAYGHRKIVELLIAAGADVNVKNENGKTTLHFAVLNGRKVIVELLIAKGADVNAKDEDGETPLDATYVFNKTETADLLRKHGAKTSEELKAEGK